MKARVQEENSQSISPPFSQGWAASLAILCFFHSSSFHDPVATKKPPSWLQILPGNLDSGLW